MAQNVVYLCALSNILSVKSMCAKINSRYFIKIKLSVGYDTACLYEALKNFDNGFVQLCESLWRFSGKQWYWLAV